MFQQSGDADGFAGLRRTGVAEGSAAATAGFDDFEMAAMVDPAVSVVRQPVENIVRHAVSILFERIGGNEALETQNVGLLAEMIYRRSCGCH